MMEYLDPRQGVTVRVTAWTIDMTITEDDTEAMIRESFEHALERFLALRKMEAA